jgi:hypothetical protein
MLFHCFTGCSTVMYKQDPNHKIYGPVVTNCDDYALFLRILKNCRNALGFSDCLTKYRIRRKSLSSNKIKKLPSFFEVMLNCESKNLFLAFTFLVTNQLVKYIWKYKHS